MIADESSGLSLEARIAIMAAAYAAEVVLYLYPHLVKEGRVASLVELKWEVFEKEKMLLEIDRHITRNMAREVPMVPLTHEIEKLTGSA